MHRTPSLQAELDGKQHPHADGLASTKARLEQPATHGIRGGAVEVGMAGRRLDRDLGDTTGGADEHPEQRRAVDSQPPGARRVRRPHLVSTTRCCRGHDVAGDRRADGSAARAAPVSGRRASHRCAGCTRFRRAGAGGVAGRGGVRWRHGDAGRGWWLTAWRRRTRLTGDWFDGGRYEFSGGRYEGRRTLRRGDFRTRGGFDPRCDRRSRHGSLELGAVAIAVVGLMLGLGRAPRRLGLDGTHGRWRLRLGTRRRRTLLLLALRLGAPELGTLGLGTSNLGALVVGTRRLRTLRLGALQLGGARVTPL